MVHILALISALSVGQVSATVGNFADGPIAFRDTSVGVTVSSAAFTTLALNASKTTDAIKVKGYRFIKFTLKYVFGAATAVTMTCQNSEDGTVWSDIHVLQYTTFPTATSSPQTWSYAAGASKTWDWTVAVEGVYMRCSFVATGSPTASDTLTVTARAGF
jgi:hypothetical protein